MEDESNIDKVVRIEVARFLENEQMTEANLIKLDQRLAELLSLGRSNTNFNNNRLTASRGSQMRPEELYQTQ
jgi:hypothetical protein